MTDHFLIITPTDPYFVPALEQAQIANDYLFSLLPEAEMIIWNASETAEFVDPGDNFQRILCPACGAEIAIADWQGMMDAAYASHFGDLTTTTPCCGAVGSLNDLHYEWPAGFARFTLEALNPQADLDDSHLLTLESILGCPVRVIWRAL